MSTNILDARHAAGALPSDKVGSNAYDRELEQGDPVLASTGMDLLRLRRLGVQQETKVRPSHCTLRPERCLELISSLSPATLRSGHYLGLHCYHDVYLGIRHSVGLSIQPSEGVRLGVVLT